MGVSINSSSAMMALGELNKNINKAGKELTKIASGEKFAGAKDGIADYQISEEMRTDIRAILQDNQNIQNGSSAVQIASGAVEDIVENLRQLKELAVNAATDTNNDSDRGQLQKMVKQTIATINDVVDQAQYNGKPLLAGAYGNPEEPEPLTIFTGSADKPYTINKDGAYNLSNDVDYSGYDPLEIKINVDALSADSKIRLTQDSPLANKPKSIEIQFVHASGELVDDKETLDKLADTLPKIEYASLSPTPTFNPTGTVAVKYMDTNQDPAVETTANIDVAAPDSEEVSFRKDYGAPFAIHSGLKANQSTDVFLNDMHIESLKSPVPTQADYDHLKALSTEANPKAAQEYEDYTDVLMKAKDMTLSDIDISTREGAEIAIRVIDSALSYALDQSTTIGAYLNRLDFTSSNVATVGENMQAAESTIRDLDMAKAMISYTKDNVLSQAAQSMLAQANQNQSQVLSLLQ